MVDMIVDQNPLGVRDRLFDSKKLLGNIGTRRVIFEHGDDFCQMPVGTFQTRRDLGM